MANTSISNLVAGGAVTATDLFPDVQVAGVGPVKVTAAQIKTFTNTPNGSDTQVQFNDGGAFAGNSGFTFSKATGSLSVPFVTATPAIDAPAGTFRRNSSGQTSNILNIQTEANGALAAFDKNGALVMNGSTSGTVTVSAPAIAGTTTFTLPSSNGTNGYVLTTNGSGVTSWSNPTALGVDLDIGSTATNGGAAGQIMFDTGSVLQESSNLVWDNTNKKLTITGATVTTSQPVLDMTQTWNNASTVFTGVKLNVTNTASNVTSKFFDSQIGGTTFFKIDGYGSTLINNGTAGYTGYYLYLNTTDANSVLFLGNSSTGAVAGFYGLVLGLGGNNSLDTGFFRSSAGNFKIVNGSSANGNLSGLLLNQLNFATGNTNTADAIISRRAAANLRFGAADAAAPVAQTLSVQSVVAGTTDTAGANLTITGSQSTGTGAAGTIIFQTASAAASTGTAQNALATVATIGPNTLTGSQAINLLSLSQTWNTSGTPTALLLNVTDTASNAASLLMDLQVGGVSQVSIRKNGLVNVQNSIQFQGGALLGALGGVNRLAYGNALSASSIYVFFNPDSGPPIATFRSNWAIGWSSSSTNPVDNAYDLALTRRGAANLRLGAADAAAPVAQTLSVQSVVAGTSNTAGANLTITGSQGTGTGAGGSIIFQVAPAGSSGTAQNALTDALTINSSGTISLGANGSATTPSIGRGNSGVYFTAATGSPLFLTAAGSYTGYIGSGTFSIPNAGRLGFESAGVASANDTIITRRGAANLRFGAADAAAPVAQTLSVQSVLAGTTDTAGSNFTITGSQGTGTGVGGDIIFQVATAGTTGTSQNALASAWTIKSTKVTQQAVLTVATLPTGAAGMRAFVSDSSVAGSGNFGATVAGGGANNVPVYFDGTNWCIG